MGAWVALARPAMLPWLGCALFLGTGFAHWEHGLHLQPPVVWALGWVAAAWTALHVGTMWLNAARDRDDGPVLFGRAAPVPEGLSWGGAAALVLCVALAVPAGAGIAGCALLAVILSVLYSHPATAWKAHPLGGPVVNMVGYGVLTPLAGHLVVAPVMPRGVLVLVASALGMGGLSFAAQAFQGDEDAARGDRTLVVTHGPRVAVLAARGLVLAAAGLALGAAAAGWLPRALLLGLPGVWWVDRGFARWAARAETAGPEAAQSQLLRLLWVVVGLVVLATIDYVVGQVVWGRPPAGLGTVVVPRW